MAAFYELYLRLICCADTDIMLKDTRLDSYSELFI